MFRGSTLKPPSRVILKSEEVDCLTVHAPAATAVADTRRPVNFWPKDTGLVVIMWAYLKNGPQIWKVMMMMRLNWIRLSMT